MAALWKKLGIPVSCSAVLPFLGCASEGPAAIPSHQITDSSGVEIVWSGPVINEEETAWRIGADPLLQIGKVEGEAPYIFEQISAAIRAPDGRIIVADARALEIRVFGADGVHETSFGGQGEGPTEFLFRPFLALAPPDTLVVWDPRSYRLSWFDFEGTLLHQRPLAHWVSGLPLALGFPSWDLGRSRYLLWKGPPQGGYGDGERIITLVDHEQEETLDLGLYPAFGNVPTSNRGISLMDWFEPSADATLGPEPLQVAISAPESWEVRFFGSNGALLRILRAPISRIPVTAEVRDARRANLEYLVTQFRLPSGEGAEIDGRLPVPDSLPAIRSVLWDRAGNLWVGRRAPNPSRTEDYDVFDAQGRWLSTVHFPRDLGYIREIGEDYLLATWSDDLGVQYLRSYPLEKPGGGYEDGDQPS